MCQSSGKTTQKESEPKDKEKVGDGETVEKEKPYLPPPPYKPPISYPQRLAKSKSAG